MATLPAQPVASTSTKNHAPLPRTLQRELGGPSIDPKTPASSLIGLDDTLANSKLAGKHIPLDNLPKESESRKAKKASKASEAHKRKMSKIRGHRVRGLVPKEERRSGDGQTLNWTNVMPVHRLWLGYMADLLGLPISGARSQAQAAADAPVASTAPPVVGQSEKATEHGFTSTQVASWQVKLTKADFHGCRMIVKRSPNASLVGLEGIVVQETENTFTVVTQKRGAKVLPKKGSIFSFQLPLSDHRAISFDISGSQFAHRPADRATRKVKVRPKGEFSPWD